MDQKDLSQCKGMLKPPPKLDEVFAATSCLLAGIMPSIVITKSGKVKDPSWDASKKQVSHVGGPRFCLHPGTSRIYCCYTQLMGNIKEYMTYLKDIKKHVDENTINPNNFKEIRQYIETDYFNVETMSTKNSAAGGLTSFVLNIVTVSYQSVLFVQTSLSLNMNKQYYDIVTTVEPKRRALAEANQQLEEANAKLKSVMENVASLEEKLAKLTKELNEANASKQEAEDAVSGGEKKLNLAKRLTTALASENERWAENVQGLRQQEKLLTGDVLLASSFISYVGPFTKPFRAKLMDTVFKPFLEREFGKISSGDEAEGYVMPMSSGDVNPVTTLTTPAEVAQWNADSLPADIVSTENGCLVCNTSASFN